MMGGTPFASLTPSPLKDPLRIIGADPIISFSQSPAYLWGFFLSLFRPISPARTKSANPVWLYSQLLRLLANLE